MNKAPTPENLRDRIIQNKYDKLKEADPERINIFETILYEKVDAGINAFRIPCVTEEDYKFYSELVNILGYPELRHNAWNRETGTLHIGWRRNY